MPRLATAFILASALVAPALAQETSQNAVINRVLQSDADQGQRSISFCARPNDAAGDGPGHAFVLFQHHARDGKRVEFLAVGHGPAGPKRTVVPVPGVLAPESFTHTQQHCLEIRVDSRRYDFVRALVEENREFEFAGIKVPIQKQYFLVFDDCVKFMEGVAKALQARLPDPPGFIVPRRISGLLPMTYVDALTAANPT